MHDDACSPGRTTAPPGAGRTACPQPSRRDRRGRATTGSSDGGAPRSAAGVGDAAQRYAAPVQRDYADALAVGVQGTPTLFVDGVRYRGRVTAEGLRAAIAAARS